jgi:vancomycin resistance protein YoaR
VPSTRRLLLGGAGAVVVLLGAGAAVAAATTSGEVPRGVTVGSIELGGLQVAAAEQRLDEGLAPLVSQPVTLQAEDEELALDPEDAGLEVDTAATARAAADAGPLDRLRALFSAGREVDPVLRTDASALRAALTEAAEPFDRDPREGSIAFEGVEPVPTDPLAGRALDLDGAAEAVVDAWPLERQVEVPVDEREVQTTAEDVQRAVREIAEPAVAAPISLDSEGGVLEVSPEAIAAAVRVEDRRVRRAGAGRDGQALLNGTAGLRRGIEEPAVDATFDTSSGTPVVVPSQTGRGFGPDETAAAVRSVLTAPAPREARVEFTTTQPRVTTEIASGLGVVEQISSYTSKFPCCAPRVTNIRRIAEIVDGYVVLPGETFDLNAYVGPRDTARGFVPAPQILRGEFVNDVGGGVSQFATTIFNGYFFAGLEDVTHTPHSYYISRYPPGREATVSFPVPDLDLPQRQPERRPHPRDLHRHLGDRGDVGDQALRGRRAAGAAHPRDHRAHPLHRAARLPARQRRRGLRHRRHAGVQAGRRGGKREEFKTRYLPQPKFVCGPPPGPRPAAPAPAPAEPAPPPAEPPPPPPAPTG